MTLHEQRSYFKAASESATDSPFSRAFNNWQYEQCREVKIRSYKDHPEVHRRVDEFIKTCGEPEVKRCFENALALCMHDMSMLYVEGYCVLKHKDFLTPSQTHAWNCYDGFHFDLTTEIGLRKIAPDVGFDDYLQIIALEPLRAAKLAERTDLELAVEVFREIYNRD